MTLSTDYDNSTQNYIVGISNPDTIKTNITFTSSDSCGAGFGLNKII